MSTEMYPCSHTQEPSALIVFLSFFNNLVGTSFLAGEGIPLDTGPTGQHLSIAFPQRRKGLVYANDIQSTQMTSMFLSSEEAGYVNLS